MAPARSKISSLHVAVIGAGAAGLVAARELRRENHSVVVFERDTQVGGLWVYTPESEHDPLSLDPNRTIVHSSVYDSLRTNLPRECMGYRDFPFVPRPEDDESRDPRRYPSHREVLAYHEDFAREFKLVEMVRFKTEVVPVEPQDQKWRVQSNVHTTCMMNCLCEEFLKVAPFSSESISRRKMNLLLVSLASSVSELKMIAALQIGNVVFSMK